MKVNLQIVPPGGGEGDYWFFAELPAVPRIGDYVTVLPSDDGKFSAGSGEPLCFVVRAVWWNTRYFKEGEVRLQNDGICVVVEEAESGFDLEQVRAKFQRYRSEGRSVVTLDMSGY